MSTGWQALRETDRDLALALLFAPAASRDVLADRLSLAIEAETAINIASEPMLAAIRLQWWVEAIENKSGESVPLMERLLRHLDRGALGTADLVAQMGHWQDRLSTSPEDKSFSKEECFKINSLIVLIGIIVNSLIQILFSQLLSQLFQLYQSLKLSHFVHQIDRAYYYLYHLL